MTSQGCRLAVIAVGMGFLAAPAHAQQVVFSKSVLPIFQKRCQLCHGADARGGLKLDTIDAVRQGGAKGRNRHPW